MSATLAGLPCRDHALKRKTGTVPRNAARHSTGPCGPWTECRHGQARAKAGWAAYAQPRGPPPIRCAGNWRALRPCHNGTATRQQRYQPDAEACATDSQLVYSVLPVPEPAPFFRELQASELVSRNFIAWPLPAAGHRSPQARDGVFRSRHGAKKTVAGVIRVDMPANEMRALRYPSVACAVAPICLKSAPGLLGCCNRPCAGSVVTALSRCRVHVTQTSASKADYRWIGRFCGKRAEDGCRAAGRGCGKRRPAAG